MLQNTTVLTTNLAYDRCEQRTTHEWMARVFASGETCLLEQESLSLDEEIGEGTFGKVFKGLLCVGYTIVWSGIYECNEYIPLQTMV